MLCTGELYRGLGGDYFRKRGPARVAKRVVALLGALGRTVTLREAGLPESYFPVSVRSFVPRHGVGDTRQRDPFGSG
jgi:hypothetical protein